MRIQPIASTIILELENRIPNSNTVPPLEKMENNHVDASHAINNIDRIVHKSEKLCKMTGEVQTLFKWISEYIADIQHSNYIIHGQW